MDAVIGGKKYNTATAELVASDKYWDGHNWERHGRNTYLYKTRKGNFFALHETCWQGEHDSIEPLVIEEAKEMYENLQLKTVDYETVFGAVEEA